jgi:small GTP-binding protein
MTVTGRVVLIGESQVGKTSLIQRLLHGEPSTEKKSTIGAVFHTHDLTVSEQRVTLQIWDTAGQERYRALGPIYYRKSRAAIAVFDLTRQETMIALGAWIKTFRENADDGFVIVAGNKSDLDPDPRLDLDSTTAWARGFDAECIWSSAETGVGVAEIFHAVSRHIIETSSPVQWTTEPEPPTPIKDSASCC